ncbi:MAG: spore germination protein [Oscillospiraceae bacterium]|nr:spore germination protein [Oscillospiraceae bacterium]
MSILKKGDADEAKIKPDKLGEFHLDRGMMHRELEKNIELMRALFSENDSLIIRQFENRKRENVRCCIFFFDGMVDSSTVDEYVILPIMESTALTKGEDGADVIISRVIATNDAQKTRDINKLAQDIMRGDTVLFADGCDSAVVISSKSWKTRSITEPDAERALRGPREGFNEALLINLSMLRRKLLTPDLKIRFRTLGTRTNTKVCVCWLGSLVDEKLMTELNKRLDAINIDGVLDTNYISELIKDNPMSPFKTVGTSERPDVVAAKLLEGRVAILLDGSPVVLTVPYIFIENFQSADDYYLNFYFASIGRFLRIFGFFLSVSVPAIYVAFITFHREMIPTTLSLSIMQARQGVPFPTVLECVIMLVVFEIIRETGIRMPSNIGQALSIVGALVIGQAAVDAKFISAPMVIIVAITAITGLINPKMKGATILLRFLCLFAAAFLGLYGYAFIIIAMLMHLFSMESFGTDYTSQITSYKFAEIKDNVFRAPWKLMKTRPVFEQRDIVRKS